MVLSGSTGNRARGPFVGLVSFVGANVTVYNTGISLLLLTSVWVLFKSPDRMPRDETNGLTSLFTDGVAKEGRPKFNPLPGRGVNPGASGWQSVSQRSYQLCQPRTHMYLISILLRKKKKLYQLWTIRSKYNSKSITSMDK